VLIQKRSNPPLCAYSTTSESKFVLAPLLLLIVTDVQGAFQFVITVVA
jgi:hypothetical protein